MELGGTKAIYSILSLTLQLRRGWCTRAEDGPTGWRRASVGDVDRESVGRSIVMPRGQAW